MLVLTRKTDEWVVINGEIGVRVIEIRGNAVRLGFSAPEHVTIDRYEIDQRKTRKRIAKENLDSGEAK